VFIGGLLSTVCVAAILGSAGSAFAANRYDATLRFRTIRTPHFDVHAHKGEEARAARLAAIVERVRKKFEPVLGVPRGRVQVILVDQSDLSNGWATPVPYDTIEIALVPPPSESLIGNTTDWLELVFTHEYTHILHLDRTRGFMQGVRAVFGRVPVAFPNAFLPVWQIEGLATFEESRMTGEGRVPAGDFRAIVDVAAARGRFEPIDRVSGGLTDWPSGDGSYAYGAYFHQFLADRYGAERFARLSDVSAGRLPFFGDAAFKNVYGRSTKELWREFGDSRERAPVPASQTDAAAARLTHHGFSVDAPRRAGDGTIYYAVANPDGFPALMRLPRDGAPSRVAWRALGGRTSVRGDWIVFDQVERVRSVSLYSDLYAVRTSGGDVTRLTEHARAADPDISPDGTRIVCTVQATGRRALALLDFSPAAIKTPVTIVDDPDADFTGPRWSPDGRTIVAQRRRASGYEIVLIDSQTHAVRPLVSRRDARLVTPSWSPDGTAILFSADPADASFNVFAADLISGQVSQVTDTAGGAQFPELGPDGVLTYVGYTPDGKDLFSVSLPRESWTAVPFTDAGPPPAKSADAPQPVEASPGDAANGLRAYNPFRTLAPTYWTPIVESDAGETVIGAATAMNDALGRHYYAVDAGWAGGRAQPDWHAAYAYDRWRPTLFASYADDTDPIRGGLVRSRELFAGAQLPFRRLRWTETLLAGFDAEIDTVSCTGDCRVRDPKRELRSLRGGWRHDSRRAYGYGISPEEGFAVEAAAETSRTALGSDVDAGATIADARGYFRVFGRHTVIAARAATALAWGDLAGRRVFSAAGSGPSYPVFDFGRDTVGLLRGFAPEDVIGTRVAVANLDVRFPLARIQRGIGSWPIFFHTLHAAGFVDAANAWDTTFRSADIRTATGGELSLDAVIAHYVRLTFTGGAAWTRDPTTDRSRGAFFGRLGYAF
jgi:hypothetical protein